MLAALAASRQEKQREDALRARHASEAAALRQLEDARRAEAAAERRRIAAAEERRRAEELAAAVARTREEARQTVNGGGAASARALCVADRAQLFANVRRVTAVQAFVWRAAAALGEREEARLRRTTLALGLVRANELLAATLDLETDGGLLTADGSRRRTPGGVFFTLVKQLVPPEMYKAIFHDPLDEKIRRGAKSTRRLLRKHRERVRERLANAPTLAGFKLLGRTGSTDDEPPASEEADDEADLSCPITLELFVDPVRAADGFVYERQAIVDWFARPVKGGVLSPATGAPLEDLDLAPAPDVLARVQALAV